MQPLTHLINVSIKTGQFPDGWKNDLVMHILGTLKILATISTTTCWRRLSETLMETIICTLYSLASEITIPVSYLENIGNVVGAECLDLKKKGI